LDFVYIDGDHSYEGVKIDLEISLRKLKPGGLITGDDYGPGNWWQGGVKRAVDEFGWHESVTLLWIDGTQFVLRKVH
jgi:predicted O-methyltransferase YrrM